MANSVWEVGTAAAILLRDDYDGPAPHLDGNRAIPVRLGASCAQVKMTLPAFQDSDSHPDVERTAIKPHVVTGEFGRKWKPGKGGLKVCCSRHLFVAFEGFGAI
ncbi:MAG TPA: hypothetical protein VIF02_02330 [Methylocella sp.]|jgi:hypothetical protein